MTRKEAAEKSLVHDDTSGADNDAKIASQNDANFPLKCEKAQ